MLSCWVQKSCNLPLFRCQSDPCTYPETNHPESNEEVENCEWYNISVHRGFQGLSGKTPWEIDQMVTITCRASVGLYFPVVEPYQSRLFAIWGGYSLRALCPSISQGALCSWSLLEDIPGPPCNALFWDPAYAPVQTLETTPKNMYLYTAFEWVSCSKVSSYQSDKYNYNDWDNTAKPFTTFPAGRNMIGILTVVPGAIDACLG